MEYDVAAGGAGLGATWRLLLLGGTLVSALVGAALWGLRAMFVRLLAEFDRRLMRIEDVARDVQRVDADLRRLMAEMPLHYQRRDDAVREYTTLNARMDRLTEVLIDIKGMLRGWIDQPNRRGD